MRKKIARDGRILVMMLTGAFMLVFLALYNSSDPTDTGEGTTSAQILFYHSNSLHFTTGAPGMQEGEYPAHASPVLFEKIPVNQAGVELLQTIPGIGSAFALRIVADRQANGNYSGPADLMRVSGIGEKRSAQFEKHLRFD